MTSQWANNSRIDGNTLYGYKEYLLGDTATQFPIERQIPRTSQLMDKTTGTYTDQIDGSNNLVVNSNLAGGNVILNFSTQGLVNMVGRKVDIAVVPTNDGGVRHTFINLNGNFHFIYQGAAVPLVTQSLQFPVTVASSISLTFLDLTRVLVTGDVTGYTFA